MTNTTHFRTTMQSPIGTLTIVANADAVVAIDWDGETAHEALLGDSEIVDVAAADHPALAVAVEQLPQGRFREVCVRVVVAHEVGQFGCHASLSGANRATRSELNA